MTDSGWTPVALSGAIEPGTSAGAVVEGREMVVWRDSGGAAHVWEDRCPHRGMKLSFGFVRGDHIACLYHGWEYDTGGTCRYIPAHPTLEVPGTICVATYASAEAGGMIWVWTGGGAAEAPPEAAETTAVRSLYVDAGAEAAAAALGAGLAATGPVTRAGALAVVPTAQGTLRVGIQPVDAGRTALHLTVAGTADTAARTALARAAEALRRRLEATE
jgi:nitrite reductase/ring-hydroxylating ferredoxin subunit